MKPCCYLNPIFDRFDKSKIRDYSCASHKPCVLESMPQQKKEAYLKQAVFYCPVMGINSVKITKVEDEDGTALSNEA